MTPEEWITVEQYLDASWPAQPMSDETIAAYQLELAAANHHDVLAAIRSAALAGNPAFRPSPLAVVQQLAAGAGGSLDDALRAFRRALTLGREDGMRRLAVERPDVALFVREIGWEQLRMERVDDPEYGGAVRARLATTLAACARDAALDPDRARRLALSSAGPRSIGGGMRDLVDQLRPAELEETTA
jgi:hypothetical protein